MSLRSKFLNLLFILACGASANIHAAEETLPPTRVSGAQAPAESSPDTSAEQSILQEGVRMEWLELALGGMEVEPEFGNQAKSDGPAGRLSSQFLLSEFTVLRLGAEQGISQLAGEEDVAQEQYFAGLAFAAPIGSHTRLFLETGWLREDFSQESAIRQTAQGLYAAVGLNFTLGKRVELSLRSRGDALFGQRRHDNEIGLLVNASNRYSIGLSAAVRHSSSEEERRIYLVSRINF